MVNPAHARRAAGHDRVPAPRKALVKNGYAVLTYEHRGSGVTRAHLVYTENGGEKYEEWFRADADIHAAQGKIRAKIPAGATHYVFSMEDENGFHVGYPDLYEGKKDRKFLSESAIAVGE